MINVSMCRRGTGWREFPCDFPIIALGAVSLGQLIRYGAHRYPADPVWVVATIGM